MDNKYNIALYRKYRPEKFTDVVGQEHITDTLSSVVSSNNPAHAYLFSGSRGIGKTTIARILARELGVTEKDLYEIDAASHTGVDDIRELRDSIHSLPFESPYKVYILDEAHMLSKSAFNALLKTLEEPPAHVIFILATTEPEKLPDTILSRCEIYKLKQPTKSVLLKVLEKVAKEEGKEIEKASLDLIAIMADGSFRDALSILQKVLNATAEKRVELDAVEKILGTPKSTLLNELLSYVSEADVEKALKTVSLIKKEDVDFVLFIHLLLERLRAVLLLKISPSLSEEIKTQFSEEDFAFLEKLSRSKNSHINSRVIKAFLDVYVDTKSAHIKHLPLELALVELFG